MTTTDSDAAGVCERERLAALARDISLILTTERSFPFLLQRCAESLVRHLDVAFARIWLLNDTEQVLELKASAGLYTNLHGSHSRIPTSSRLKIGQIVRDRQPRITNRVIQEGWVTDPSWATQEGMVAFAGYPLISDDRLLGVMAMFARHALSAGILDELDAISGGVAQSIARAQVEERLKALNHELEHRVAMRTQELRSANAELTREIAERVQAQQERERLTKTHRLLLESTGEGVYGIDLEGQCTFMNRAGAQLLGYEATELLGQFVHERVHHSRKDGSRCDTAACPILQSLTTGVGYRAHDDVLWTRHGSAVPVDLSSHPIIEDHRITGAVIVFSDISERKRTENALMRTQVAESLIHHAPDALFMTDRTGRILRANHAVAQLLGYRSETGLEDALARFLAPEEFTLLSSPWMRQ